MLTINTPIAVTVLVLLALLIGLIGFGLGVFLTIMYLISANCKEETWEIVTSIHYKNHKIPDEEVHKWIL
jgi:hypothetical protein